MKVTVPITSAFPAALAAASISLSLLLLPTGSAPVRSAGVAPALKLVAGEVVAVVKHPVRAVSRAQPKSVVPPATVAAATPSATTRPAASASRTRSTPAHRSGHRAGTSRTSAHRSTPVTAPPVTAPPAPAPAPAPTAAKETAARAPTLAAATPTPGKGKALGHLRKIESLPASTKTQGRPADVPHGPPAVPPGQQKDGPSAVDHGAANARGSGK